jgi:hypothetical protein
MTVSKIVLLTLAMGILGSGCGQNYNSNSSDDVLANLHLDCSGSAGGRLCAAMLAMVNNQCFSCHSTWSSNNTDSAWISSGLVTAGDPSGSLLIQKLINSGGDMPKDGNALSSDDFDALVTWIQNL